MSSKAGRGAPPERRFTAAVLLPVALSLVCTAGAVLGFVLWSAKSADEFSINRQTALARHVIEAELARLPHEQESATIWDDAVARAGDIRDRAWINNNLGVWMYQYYGHSEVLLLNPENDPVYAMKDGVEIDAYDYASRTVPQFSSLVIALRSRIARGGIASYRNGAVDHPPRVTQLQRLNGVPSIVSLVPIVSDTGLLTQPAGSQYIHISIMHLDAAFAARIAEQYQIPEAQFGTASAGVDFGQLPLSDPAGRFMTFFQWRLDLPGRDMLARTLPVITIAFLAIAAIAFMLSFQLWRKSVAVERSRADAEYRATHDSLTGLPNRSSFESLLLRALAQRPSPDRRVSVLMLDLDRFKQVNDTLGHRAGDELIRAVGQRLSQLLGPHDTIARLGGDEFAIVHIHAPGLYGPLGISGRAIDAIGKPFDIFGREAFVGVSIGIATADGGEADGHDLTRKADIALYEAKSTGRNRAVVFEESMSEFLENRQTIEVELREALRRDDQLAVAFQPLYTRDGQLSGAEALMRWTHPRLGQVSPAHFIPVAESSGLIGTLGLFILQATCRLGARWPGYTFAVNISPAQLRDPAFPASVFAMLADSGMRAEDLELEITEGILLEEKSVATEAIRVLRAAGIKIALDDFGTGYSSLNYLKRYPVDRIKIDRSFVSQLAPGSVSIAIVQAMVTLAHALDIEVTAEGVETSEQMRLLTELGCNIFQGFLLSAPVAPGAMEKLLQQPQVRVA